MDAILSAACQEVGARIPDAAVAVLVSQRRKLTLRAASAEFERTLADVMTDGCEPIGPWKVALESRRTVVSEDMTKDPRCAAAYDMVVRHELRAGWFVPVIALTGGIVGLLVVLLRRSCRPTTAQRAAIRHIAELCAVAIQQERLHARNRQAEARLKNLMASVQGIVSQWTVGPEGSMGLAFISDSVETITGMATEELIRRPRLALACIVRADRLPLIAALKRSVKSLEAISQDFRLDCGAKGIRWFRIISRPQRLTDGSIESDALCLDIDDSRSVEESLRKSQSELNERVLELHKTKTRLEAQSTVLMETARELTEARDSAEQASRAKSEFLSNMSHELRTPLNAIIGFSEIIREQTFGPVGSPKYREYASDIYLSGQHLLELINEILDFAKIGAGKEELHVETVEIREIVDSVIRMVHERVERAGLCITVNMPESLPRLRVDKRKIRQVLLNLLSNAIKFTKRGGRLAVTAWCSNGGFVLQVSDTGIGIALEDIPKALGLFGQIDRAFSRRHEGTGLGLPLSKALVEMHGGSLNLQSQPSVGTTVTIRLPAERVVRDKLTAAAGGAV